MGWRRLAAAAGLVLGLAGTAAADPLTIRIGWVQTPGHLAPLIELSFQLFLAGLRGRIGSGFPGQQIEVLGRRGLGRRGLSRLRQQRPHQEGQHQFLCAPSAIHWRTAACASSQSAPGWSGGMPLPNCASLLTARRSLMAKKLLSGSPGLTRTAKP